MNTKTKLIALSAISVFLALPAISQAIDSLPQGEFACQVQTLGGQSGLVMLQTQTNQDAVKLAGSSIALEMGGKKSKAISVVECINMRDGSAFKDSWFQAFYQKLPM